MSVPAPDRARFEAMRGGLVARGLVAGDAAGGFRLTPAGQDHVDALLVELRGSEAGGDRFKPRVRWKRSSSRWELGHG